MQRTPPTEPLVSITASLEEWLAIEKLIAIYRKQCKAMHYESSMLQVLDRFEEKLARQTSAN